VTTAGFRHPSGGELDFRLYARPAAATRGRCLAGVGRPRLILPVSGQGGEVAETPAVAPVPGYVRGPVPGYRPGALLSRPGGL